MRYVSDGIPEHEARLTFEGLGKPLYMFDKIPDVQTKPTYELRRNNEPAVYNEPIDTLDLTPRAVNVCRRNNIMSVRDVVLYTKAEFGRLRNCGATTVAAVEKCLHSLGVDFLEDAAFRKEPLPHQRP